jgi:hypothetical protein
MVLNQIKGFVFWIVLMLVFGGLLYCLPILHAQTPDTRTEEELAMQLCVNEATWNTLDCGAITHIRIRYARAHRISLREALILLHGDGSDRPTASLRSDRYTNRREGDNRAWIANLRSTLERPEGFVDDGSWESRHRISAAEVLETVRGSIAGTLRDPCRAGRVVPSIWGGRRLDAVHIERRVQAGFAPAHCGATVNLYLGRGR